MPDFDIRLFLLAGALILDGIAGEPALLWSRLPHPAVLMGRAIGFLEGALYRPELDNARKKQAGVVLILTLFILFGAAGWLLSIIFSALPYGFILEIICASILVAQKSLYDHVSFVAAALRSEGLEGGRDAVSSIVGRDPQSLNEAGVCRAALESLAENFSDGVVAPAFFYLIGGLPGLFIYKAVNTADSMVGHKNEKYIEFGWASARADDLLNLVPARISGVLIVVAAALCGKQAASSARVMWRDAGLHASPNAGWPESAMAGALGLSLGGPRVYGDNLTDDPWLNDAGRKDAGHRDIADGLVLFAFACVVQLAIILALGAIYLG